MRAARPRARRSPWTTPGGDVPQRAAHDERAVALCAVRAAARVCIGVQRELAAAGRVDKKDRSPVTVADFAAQAVVCRVLAEHFPGDPIMAEEDTSILRRPGQDALVAAIAARVSSECGPVTGPEILDWIDRGRYRLGKGKPGVPRFWALDPVDGTKGFLRGEHYAIALSLLVEGHVVLGALACPNLVLPRIGGEGTVFYATRGGGAWAMPLFPETAAAKRLRVSTASDPATMRMVESVAHADHALHATIAGQLGITRPPVRLDSQAKYGILAAGEAELYLRVPLPDKVEYREKLWDHAAGALVVEEAGGRVSDILGRPLDFTLGARLAANTGLVVTNGPLHERIVHAVSLFLP
jgi:3'(2'), 5'-bisphosphate nucleotidase